MQIYFEKILVNCLINLYANFEKIIIFITHKLGQKRFVYLTIYNFTLNSI